MNSFGRQWSESGNFWYSVSERLCFLTGCWDSPKSRSLKFSVWNSRCYRRVAVRNLCHLSPLVPCCPLHLSTQLLGGRPGGHFLYFFLSLLLSNTWCPSGDATRPADVVFSCDHDDVVLRATHLTENVIVSVVTETLQAFSNPLHSPLAPTYFPLLSQDAAFHIRMLLLPTRWILYPMLNALRTSLIL